MRLRGFAALTVGQFDRLTNNWDSNPKAWVRSLDRREGIATL